MKLFSNMYPENCSQTGYGHDQAKFPLLTFSQEQKGGNGSHVVKSSQITQGIKLIIHLEVKVRSTLEHA